MQAMEISKTGLDVEWRRLETIATNIANASTTLDADGQVYRPLRLLSGPTRTFAELASGKAAAQLRGVSVYSIEAQNLPDRKIYEPGHPQADPDGYVTYPGFDHAAEMALMIKTSRSYEANVVALNTARQMYARALDIGKR
jgi:flagellar basal-body rod protein FlgC